MNCVSARRVAIASSTAASALVAPGAPGGVGFGSLGGPLTPVRIAALRLAGGLLES